MHGSIRTLNNNNTDDELILSYVDDQDGVGDALLPERDNELVTE
jgi:hypothetical protein